MDFTKVTGANVQGLVEPILDSLRQARYIAVDTEFSGHGPSAAKHMDQRYQDLSNIIRTHTLFSFGLTVISSADQQSSYQFTNLEFLTRNQQSYQMDPNNIKFLSENGLDFQQIFSGGIPFTSGTTDTDDILRQLWHGILKIIKERQIPLIVHNGLLDIMYLYQSFFASLPEKLATFVADLVDMFPAGIYDTKYLATELLAESKTYLAYLYCKYRRLSPAWSVRPPLTPVSLPLAPFVDIKQDDSTDSPSKKRRKRMKKHNKNKDSKGICGLYAHRGWCKRGKECDLSHDLQIILDRDLGTLTETQAPVITTEKESTKHTTLTENERHDHSAHFDAYMTAFIFCHFLSTTPLEDLAVHVNKLNLMRMDIPLRLVSSHYAKPSTEWIRIKSLLWP